MQYSNGTLAQADISFSLKRQSDNSVVAWYFNDRYASPTGPQQVTTNFAPHYITLAPGDALAFYEACVPVNGTPATAAHVFFTFYYTVGQP